ncbi:MAG TPA: Kdo hydroxylase family protein [Phenylobacterium sp.]|uniref:Kdo hydroxylase family protein n=1 Tax=Phenylobacterium sp. TaxID=1871053 RepID=UPI002BBC4813|nr:Kdo hydroxylase family protein [Phenylobacterium sp.]HSV03830.1 Kdo hydroxylase family protein [Phenylobacterium sp.]
MSPRLQNRSRRTPSTPPTERPVATVARTDVHRAMALLEHGHVLMLPDLAFETAGAEAVMYAATSEAGVKNVSFNPATGELKGASLEGEPRQRLTGVVARYSDWAEALVRDLLPAYGKGLQKGRASFRPRAADHNLSKRKDDRRLHIDAFPSQPVQGRRILRVFRNVNPAGEARNWRVGEPFADYAARFLPHGRPMAPGMGAILQALHVTKGRRTAYDALMLRLHDAAKDDDDYQAHGPRWEVDFPAGATWMCFTDCVVHAALGGRYAFEQTFYLPVAAMGDPAVSPLRTLEAMTGRRLV